MKDSYVKVFVEIERMNKLSLDLIKNELNRMRIVDINEVQCLILYRLGEKQVSVGDLKKHGYYVGTNVAHNMKKMVKNGYLLKTENTADTRGSLVKLSEKGMELQKRLENLFAVQASCLESEGVGKEDLNNLDLTLINIGSFWTRWLTQGEIDINWAL